MAEFDPSREQYLAVVSEWSGVGKSSAGRVGNAYPLYSFTHGRAVTQPAEEFPNPGYVFLVNRGDLRGGDFVRVQPSENITKPYKETDCAFVIKGNVVPIEGQGLSVAVVIEVPAFDPESADMIIRRPDQPVTPVFFVKCGQKYFGPLHREKLLTGVYEGAWDSLHWTAAGRDNVFYEFAPGMLRAQGVNEVVYEPQEPIRNEVIRRPFRMLVGPIDKVKSSHPHDRLPEAQLAEWYLKSQKIDDVPTELVQRLRTAADQVSEGTDEVTQQRCRRVARLFTSLTAFQGERSAVAGRYLRTDEGKKALEEVLQREVEHRAKDIDAQVKQLQAEQVSRRQQLSDELEKRQREHDGAIEKLERGIAQVESRRDALNREQEQLNVRLRDGISHLTEQIREQVPLVAALAGGVHVIASGAAAAAMPSKDAAPPGWDAGAPIEPSKPLANANDEIALVGRLTTELAAAGIGFAKDFVTNLYVSLKSQSLNLIMGPPGHGKSSAVTTLARALGHGNALLEVAVRRTWSDDRYLLGFFDSFHGRYDPGPTGLATRLVQAMRDWDHKKQSLYVVLLDEFNLAAPEYYFSQLLQLVTRPCDQPRILRLFDPAMLPAGSPPTLDHLRITPNVSFWGTINYDETTERLSPRLLDRTGMIVLHPTDVVPANASFSGLPKGVPAGQLVGDFVRKPDQCPDDSWEIIRPVVDLLADPREAWGPALHLSPRVLDGVRRYLANADKLLSHRAAADFAIQQRILPVVRGRGPAFAARVRALSDKLAEAGLERTTRHVRDALALADAHYGDVDMLAYV